MFLVFGPFYVLFLLAGWIALGLAWAPFAAFISMRKARRFGLNPLKFAALAFLLSLFFIFPWLYLNDALNGTKPNELRKSLADRVEPCSLFVLYATWLLGPIALMGVLIMVTASPPPSFVDDQTSGPLAPVLLIVFLLMWGRFIDAFHDSRTWTSEASKSRLSCARLHPYHAVRVRLRMLCRRVRVPAVALSAPHV